MVHCITNNSFDQKLKKFVEHLWNIEIRDSSKGRTDYTKTLFTVGAAHSPHAVASPENTMILVALTISEH